ncbi:hypothetical protein PI124_g13389 [Phytophthora idaei]|nr:hypothetical protein PI126_g14464 [Phytophthora idaei]KAG3241749.1 hypothetical protein PI124_g13389 [Phytophthora idaei]
MNYALLGSSANDGVFVWISLAVDMTAEQDVKAVSTLAGSGEAASNSSVELPLHRPGRFNSLKLLQRIWDSSEKYVDDTISNADEPWTLCKYIPTDKQYQFTLSLLEIVELKNIEMLRWVVERFQDLKVLAKR